MIHELIHILTNNASVSFSKQEETIIITINDNGSVSQARFSFEEIYDLSRGDCEACEAVLGETIDGLFEESELKLKRNTKIRDDLSFYLTEIEKRKTADAEIVEGEVLEDK